MTGIRVRCLDHRGHTEHRGVVLGVTQDGHDTQVVVLCDDGAARVVHHKRIRAEQTQPQTPNMLQPITPLTMIGPGLWERSEPPP